MRNDKQGKLFRRTMEEKQIFEKENLSPLACMSSESEGREVQEQEDLYLTCFEVDRERILSSAGFRRLNGKTQVFSLPKTADVSNRMIHTYEVEQLATYIASNLGLNIPLVQAIAFGHDVGHPPGGHAGERVLTELGGVPFKHQENSVKVLQSEGLNLAYEVIDGILKHSCGSKKISDSDLPETMEGLLVAYVDKIAYTFNDIEDAKKAGLIKESSLPDSVKLRLGTSARKRIITLREALIDYSLNKSEIGLSDEMESVFEETRDFMFKHVYKHIMVSDEERKFGECLRWLYGKLPTIETFYGKDPLEVLAYMTDTEALDLISEYMMPDSLV
ncbi:MAG: HD domain-containing protein [Nanoarchaeota archaeon]